MTTSKKRTSRITSIQYVHDPEAAREWVALLMEMAKKHFLDEILNKDK